MLRVCFELSFHAVNMTNSQVRKMLCLTCNPQRGHGLSWHDCAGGHSVCNLEAPEESHCLKAEWKYHRKIEMLLLW